jgi:gliding motility-associated-like protein
VNTTPLANFTFGGACLPSGLTQFTDQTTPAGIISNWSWNFGDGSPAWAGSGAAYQNPQHVYATTGPFNVTLTVTSSGGCIDDSMKVMNVVYAQPHADFAMDSATSCAGNTVHFTDNLSTAPGSSVTGWNWNFGDPASGANNTSTLQNPNHLYATPGTYQVKHWVTSAASCPSDTMTKTVTVVALPTASFTVSTPLCATKTVTLTSTSTTATGSINSISWTINGSAAGTGSPLSFTPATPGNYTIVLTVGTTNGCTSQTTQIISINTTPLASFTFGGACLPSGLTQFTDQTTPAGITSNWSWDFGDGSPAWSGSGAAYQNPQHVYASAGPFNVTLTVTSTNGCVDDSMKVMNVVYPQPTAVITAPAEACNGSTVTFSGASSTAPNNSVQTYNWNFGDGNTGTGSSPTHAYAGAGSYTVTLTVISAAGCSSAPATATIVINPLPTANFALSAPNCLNQSITFTDASIANVGSIATWNWNFGDGGTSALQSPTHTFGTVGPFNVTLQVTNTKGCTSAIFSLPVVVHELPVTNFTVTPGCVNDVIQFTDGSAVANGSITGWNWNFGDAGVSVQQNPTHLYASAITYNVTLTATSNFGCTGSVTKPFTPAGMVNTNFNIQGGGTSFCSGSTVNLTDNSTVSPGAITKVEVYWDYLNNPTVKTTDNAPLTGTVYSHVYPEFGSPASQNVTIRYYSYSGQSCTQFVDRVITLRATPTVYFNAVNGICADVPAFQITQAGISNVLPGTGVFSGPGVSSTGLFNPATAGAGSQVIRYTYTAANGCSNYKDQTIDVYPVPIADAGPDRTMIEGGQVTLVPNSNYGYPVSYLWTPGTYLDNPNTSKPKASPPFDFTYTLRVTSDKGCSTTDQVFVKILKNPVVPNIFSPNGDGVHDQWVIPFLNTYPGCTVDIFNRYGQLIFHSVGYNTPWDGTVNGKQVPVGTYYYIIDPKNGRVKMSGYVDVIR